VTREPDGIWDISPDAKKSFERVGVDWKEICREGSDTWRICRIEDKGKEGILPSRPMTNFTMPEMVKYLSGNARPEFHRQAMREVLLDSIDSENARIRFDAPVGGI